MIKYLRISSLRGNLDLFIKKTQYIKMPHLCWIQRPCRKNTNILTFDERQFYGVKFGARTLKECCDTNNLIS